MATINVRVDDKLDELIREEARSLGLRRGDIVRMALRQWATIRLAPVHSGKELLERARNSIGSLRTGVPDLAERYEEYLAEVFDEE